LTEGYNEIVFLRLGSWHSDPCEQCHALRLHRIFCYTR